MIEKEELDRFIASCKDEQAELLMTLGRIPAPSHHEEKRAAFCKKWFEHEGCNEVWIDEAQNVICKFNCDRYDEITVMMAHMDVVFNDTEELPMRRDGDILRAPGIGDDTANLVNLMLATRFLVQHKDRLHTGLMIVANRSIQVISMQLLYKRTLMSRLRTKYMCMLRKGTMCRSI